MHPVRRVPVAIALILLLAWGTSACDGPLEPDPNSMTGVWVADRDVPGYTGLSLVLMEGEGGSITGTWSASLTASSSPGPVEGSVIGSRAEEDVDLLLRGEGFAEGDLEVTAVWSSTHELTATISGDFGSDVAFLLRN